MSLQNVWHHRHVAEASAKACWICYKPSSSVLITPDKKVCEIRNPPFYFLILGQDFFYICIGHLADRKFCVPDTEEAAAAEARKKKEELDREIELVKKEYEEKQKLKREKRKSKDKGKEKDKDTEKKEEEEDKKEEDVKDAKVRYSFEVPKTAFD
jgi:hypothetical protein